MSFTYLNLQGKLEHVDVTAEDIDRQLQRLLQANPRIIPVTGRAAALGDELVLDYAGFSEGVQFPGGTAEKQTLTLGSGMFIPGFDRHRHVPHRVSRPGAGGKARRVPLPRS